MARGRTIRCAHSSHLNAAAVFLLCVPKIALNGILMSGSMVVVAIKAQLLHRAKL